MRLTAYLNFNGDCAQAFKFYEKCLSGKLVTLMTHAESPMADQVPAGWRDLGVPAIPEGVAVA